MLQDYNDDTMWPNRLSILEQKIWNLKFCEYFICLLPSVTDRKFSKKSWSLESTKTQIRRHKCSNSIVNSDVDSCDKFNLCRNLTVCTRYVLIFWNMQLHVNSFPVLHPLSKANYLMHNIRLTMAYVCWRQFHGGIILIIFDQCNIWDNQAMS